MNSTPAGVKGNLTEFSRKKWLEKNETISHISPPAS
jgi:hypothetical protein